MRRKSPKVSNIHDVANDARRHRSGVPGRGRNQATPETFNSRVRSLLHRSPAEGLEAISAAPKRGDFSASEEELRGRQGEAHSCGLQHCFFEHPVFNSGSVGPFTVLRTEDSALGGMQCILIEAEEDLLRDGLQVHSKLMLLFCGRGKHVPS